jgi:hypothetical protein
LASRDADYLDFGIQPKECGCLGLGNLWRIDLLWFSMTARGGRLNVTLLDMNRFDFFRIGDCYCPVEQMMMSLFGSPSYVVAGFGVILLTGSTGSIVKFRRRLQSDGLIE